MTLRPRIGRIQQWEQLAALLNSDGGGDTKSTEKWKKVWSDYKNNPKKKSAQLHRVASGTGGGPATHTKLTDLEERVLQIMGRQVATGLAVDGLGPTPTNIQEQNTPETTTSASLSDIIVLEGQWNQPGQSSRILIPPPSPQDLILQENVIDIEDCETHCVTEPEPVALASPHRNIRLELLLHEEDRGDLQEDCPGHLPEDL